MYECLQKLLVITNTFKTNLRIQEKSKIEWEITEKENRS